MLSARPVPRGCPGESGVPNTFIAIGKSPTRAAVVQQESATISLTLSASINVGDVAHAIQLAFAPVFLLTGIAGNLNVMAGASDH